jgi:hypothetical protein
MTGKQPLRLALFLLCLTVLFARLGGAHLHLCLDGQEAPLSVHASEPEHSDAHHDDPTTHSDQDVSLIDDTLTPLSKLFADLPTLLAVVSLVLCAGALRRPPQAAVLAARASQVRFHHPPLRGPPSLSR